MPGPANVPYDPVLIFVRLVGMLAMTYGTKQPYRIGTNEFSGGLGYTRVMSPMNSADDSEILRETGTSFEAFLVDRNLVSTQLEKYARLISNWIITPQGSG